MFLIDKRGRFLVRCFNNQIQNNFLCGFCEQINNKIFVWCKAELFGFNASVAVVLNHWEESETKGNTFFSGNAVNLLMKMHSPLKKCLCHTSPLKTLFNGTKCKKTNVTCWLMMDTDCIICLLHIYMLVLVCVAALKMQILLCITMLCRFHHIVLFLFLLCDTDQNATVLFQQQFRFSTFFFF